MGTFSEYKKVGEIDETPSAKPPGEK